MKKNSNPLISIIIPFFKAETTIIRCVYSVLSQSFTDWELLLIDDGSTDESGTICEEYAKKDNRIKVFHKTNGGVSSARNVGLDNAHGEWLYFLDSDDSIDEEYLSNFIDALDGSDWYVQGTTIRDEDKASVVCFDDCHKESKYEVMKYILEHLTLGLMWHRLFNRQIIEEHNLRFDENLSLAEDEVFILQYMQYVKVTKFLSTIGHNYFVTKNSLTTKRYPLEYYSMLLRKQIPLYFKLIGDSKREHEFVEKMIWHNMEEWMIIPYMRSSSIDDICGWITCIISLCDDCKMWSYKKTNILSSIRSVILRLHTPSLQFFLLKKLYLFDRVKNKYHYLLEK